jgi:hypothetical protein
MSKPDTDYSNTLIYKITCKDPTIKDVYVGHTTNFVQRKHAHKQACINNKSPNYKCKLYETIRKTGGWANWHMEIVNFFNCKDHYEARLKEQEYFVSLNATLNSIEPLSKSKSEEVIPKNKINEVSNTDTSQKHKTKYTCDCCNYTTNNICHYNNHVLTPKHKNNEKNKKNKNPSVKNNPKYKCIKCKYHTINLYDYNKHLHTPKHIKNEKDKKSTTDIKYSCVCGKSYKYNTGYYRHKKNCNYVPPPSIEAQPILESQPQTVSCDYNLIEIIKILVKDNQEMRISMMAHHNTIIEQNK